MIRFLNLKSLQEIVPVSSVIQTEPLGPLPVADQQCRLPFSFFSYGRPLYQHGNACCLLWIYINMIGNFVD